MRSMVMSLEPIGIVARNARELLRYMVTVVVSAPKSTITQPSCRSSSVSTRSATAVGRSIYARLPARMLSNFSRSRFCMFSRAHVSIRKSPRSEEPRYPPPV